MTRAECDKATDWPRRSHRRRLQCSEWTSHLGTELGDALHSRWRQPRCWRRCLRASLRGLGASRDRQPRVSPYPRSADRRGSSGVFARQQRQPWGSNTREPGSPSGLHHSSGSLLAPARPFGPGARSNHANGRCFRRTTDRHEGGCQSRSPTPAGPGILACGVARRGSGSLTNLRQHLDGGLHDEAS